jgi:hypothetical protein
LFEEDRSDLFFSALYYHNLNFSMDAPEGHLPAGWFAFLGEDDYQGELFHMFMRDDVGALMMTALALRLEQCKV